jgi:hypothetical protein
MITATTAAAGPNGMAIMDMAEDAKNMEEIAEMIMATMDMEEVTETINNIKGAISSLFCFTEYNKPSIYRFSLSDCQRPINEDNN